MSHLQAQKLLSKKQYGFTIGRSTTIQLLSYLDQCMQTIVDGGVVDTIYLDCEDALDNVPHHHLLVKLQAYGIKGKMLNWISEFIRVKSKKVIVNEASVLSGIPQGTVLGPVLFVIYINDILENLSSEGLLFANDTNIFRTITSREDALYVQPNIKRLEDMSKKWLLCFHPDKCHVLSLGGDYSYRTL